MNSSVVGDMLPATMIFSTSPMKAIPNGIAKRWACRRMRGVGLMRVGLIILRDLVDKDRVAHPRHRRISCQPRKGTLCSLPAVKRVRNGEIRRHIRQTCDMKWAGKRAVV